MDNQIPEDYRILARERSHEDARQTVATNRMLVQTLVVINGVGAIAVLTYYATRNSSDPGKPAVLVTLLSWRLYCRFRRPLCQKNNSGMVKFLGA
jgi:hypothetical protein